MATLLHMVILQSIILNVKANNIMCLIPGTTLLTLLTASVSHLRRSLKLSMQLKPSIMRDRLLSMSRM